MRVFIDLFSGIGAFHQALKKHNFSCSYAVEIDKHAIATYKLNYKDTDVLEDITSKETINKLLQAKHLDMITAGFPCQPFSKAGKMNGFEHESGNLFYNIISLIQGYNNKKNRQPIKYLFFKNVGFLKNHNDKDTWNKMKETIKQSHYKIIGDDIIINPLQVGTPQNRVRMFLFCVHKSYYLDYMKKNQFRYKLFFEKFKGKKEIKFSALDFLNDIDSKKSNFLDDEKTKILEIWNEFVSMLNLKTLGFPIWLKYFGFSEKDTEKFRQEFFAKEVKMYDWKKIFFEKNRAFYLKNQKLINQWFCKYKDFLMEKKLIKNLNGMLVMKFHLLKKE